MAIDIGTLKEAINRLSVAMARDFEMLNQVDGALGDGDLGITMKRGMELVQEKSNELPDDLGLALLGCAQAFTKSSGSSYGTLMATGLMAMAKVVKGKTSLEVSEISSLVGIARDAMMARGKADLGGKTVLDSLDAVAKATDGLVAPDQVADAAVASAKQAMDALRDRPATIGRARIFAEKSIGMDDPGMVAMRQIVNAIAGR